MKPARDKWNAFVRSLEGHNPPPHLTVSLQSLWLARKGKWEQAHDLVNDLHDQDTMRVHAYLHRAEGDNSNAAYWYHRAGVSTFRGTLDAEWESLTIELLGDEASGQSGPVS